MFPSQPALFASHRSRPRFPTTFCKMVNSAAVCNLASGAFPTATFPNAHLAPMNSALPPSPTLQPQGACPSAAFPNSHLAKVAQTEQNTKDSPRLLEANWAAAQTGSPLDELREAVVQEDWTRLYEEGQAQLQANANWSANKERCAVLQSLCGTSGARRVLEVGAFVGVASLALAEVLPRDGEVVSLELEPYFVEFGERARLKSLSGHKVHKVVGPALASLQSLAEKAATGSARPFDMVVIDGDKGNMQAYFDLLWSSPNLLSERAVVCVDMTPFKGQPPVRYVRFGQADRWECPSGEAEMNALREHVNSSGGFVCHEFGGLMVVQRRPEDLDEHPAATLHILEQQKA